METGIVMGGLVILAIMVIAAAYMRVNRRPAVVAVVVPQGLNNPNAGPRTPINSAQAVGLGYSFTEYTTPSTHFISLTPQPAERFDGDVVRRETVDADGTRRIGGIARVRYDRLG